MAVRQIMEIVNYLVLLHTWLMAAKMFQIDKKALNQKRMIQIILEIHFIMKSSYLMNLPFKNKKI